MLVTLTPGQEGCAVRVYSCAPGSKLRVKMLDTKFNRTPNCWEVMDLQRRPQNFAGPIGSEVA
jgi:hypothetical protein